MMRIVHKLVPLAALLALTLGLSVTTVSFAQAEDLAPTKSFVERVNDLLGVKTTPASRL